MIPSVQNLQTKPECTDRSTNILSILLDSADAAQMVGEHELAIEFIKAVYAYFD